MKVNSQFTSQSVHLLIVIQLRLITMRQTIQLPMCIDNDARPTEDACACALLMEF